MLIYAEHLHASSNVRPKFHRHTSLYCSHDSIVFCRLTLQRDNAYHCVFV